MNGVWMRWMILAMVVLATALPAKAQSDLDQKIEGNIADWVGTYKHLHANPELSTQEKETSALLASTLRRLGYEVTEHFGEYEDANLVSYGVVAVLKNGPGPTVYVRIGGSNISLAGTAALPVCGRARRLTCGSHRSIASATRSRCRRSWGWP
jgi:hypothetical protein